jgi:hypothetical protein
MPSAANKIGDRGAAYTSFVVEVSVDLPTPAEGGPTAALPSWTVEKRYGLDGESGGGPQGSG